ncbi:hypothetical protein Tco_0928154 [Tanacetum coccineum]
MILKATAKDVKDLFRNGDQQKRWPIASSSSSNANSKEKIRFMKIDLDDKTDVLTYHKKLLAEAVKEKEELKTKLESFETSSKSLNKLLNSQLSVNDKAGFGHNGAKESKVCETITSMSKVETSNSETSNDKVEVPKIKTVRMSEPIIEEWESNSEDDEIVVKPKEVTKQSNLAIFLAE